MSINELIITEKNELITSIINNSILYNNKIEANKLKNKLETIFSEISKIIIANPYSLESIQNAIINNFWEKIEIIVKNTPGLTIGIKDNRTNGELYIYHGKISSLPNSQSVDENTLFDLASVTKLFTAVSLLKEQEKGNLDLSKPINYYDKRYKNIDKTIEDIAKFYYQINTDGRLDSATSKEELTTRLYNSKVVKENTFLYSDIPYIILKDVLQSIGNDFSSIFEKELNMINTSYNTRKKIITGGNFNNLNKIHDPKAQRMKELGLPNMGHAGLYSTSKDLVKLGNNLLPTSSFLTKQSLDTLTTPSHNERQFINPENNELKNKNRAMGVYIQTDKGISQSDISIASSKEAFASSGTTGPYILVDPTNNYTFNYLCNPYSQKNRVPIININGEDKRWGGATNIIKEELMNLVYELRYITNIYEKLGIINNSAYIINATYKLLKSTKSIKK